MSSGPPPLPAGAPDDLRAFVAGTRDEVELAPGRAAWLPVPGGLGRFAPKPTVAFPADGEVVVRWGPARLTLELRVRDGRLSVDTSRVPGFLGLVGPIERWVADLDAHAAAQGRRFLPPRRTPSGGVLLATEPNP